MYDNILQFPTERSRNVTNPVRQQYGIYELCEKTYEAMLQDPENPMHEERLRFLFSRRDPDMIHSIMNDISGKYTNKNGDSEATDYIDATVTAFYDAMQDMEVDYSSAVDAAISSGTIVPGGDFYWSVWEKSDWDLLPEVCKELFGGMYNQPGSKEYQKRLETILAKEGSDAYLELLQVVDHYTSVADSFVHITDQARWNSLRRLGLVERKIERTAQKMNIDIAANE